MNLKTVIAVGLLVLAAQNARAVPQTAESEPAKHTVLAITHVSVIDTAGGATRGDVTVVVADGRVTELGESGKIRIPKDAQVVDATGKFLIPGLWDMHVHLEEDPEYLPLFVANGVTGIRVMWGEAVHHKWREEIEAGKLVGPRMLIGSPIIDGPKPFWRGSIGVANESEAREAVVKSKRYGADFVKILTFLPREEYFAIADEAKKQGIPFEGHVPEAISAEEASNAGQKSFEHLFGILPACSTREEELSKAAQEDLAEYLVSDKHQFEGPRVHALKEEMIASYNAEKASKLFALLKKNGTWQCPTLTVLHTFSFADDPTLASEAGLKYVALRRKTSWEPGNLVPRFSSENMVRGKDEFELDLKVVAAMEKSGVGILAGTDTGNPYCVAGFSLHDELGYMVAAGLTPMEALQAATLNPANFFGQEKEFGTIAVGKVADMVLLDADPLKDIGNTRKISAVMLRGKLLPKSALEGMMSNVEAFAKRQPIGDVLFATMQKENVDAAVKKYRELKATAPQAYDFRENEFIVLGYRLMHLKNLPGAIAIFKLAVESYPTSFNAYDSLGEAFMENGDKDLAIANYKKALELNPESKNAAKKLKELSEQ